MCNMLHKEKAKPIKKEGFGYKIFYRPGDISPDLKSCVSGDNYLKITPDSWNRDEWFIWDGSLFGDYYSQLGFCFFLSKREAKKAMHDWARSTMQPKKYVVRKIAYSDGMGKHVDCGFTGAPYMIALCKKFKILEGEVK